MNTLRIFACGFYVTALLAISQQTFAITIQDPNYVANLELDGLLNPMGVSTDSLGRVYVADSGNGTILRGGNGSYSTLISGINVGTYNGYQVSMLGVHVTASQQLLLGEGGRATGVEQVWHYDLDGNLQQALPAIASGGNWYGITTAASDDTLYALSANGDRIFKSNRSGASWSALSNWVDLTALAIEAPTAAVVDGDAIYVAAYGSFLDTTGAVYKFDRNTGTLLSTVVGNLSGPTGLAKLSDGRLLLSEFGSFTGGPGFGKVSILDPTSGTLTALASDLAYGTSVATSADGSIYITEIQAANQRTGRLWKVQAVPEPSILAMWGVGSALFLRKRRNRQQ